MGITLRTFMFLIAVVAIGVGVAVILTGVGHSSGPRFPMTGFRVSVDNSPRYGHSHREM
jgi:hypothetical protein